MSDKEKESKVSLTKKAKDQIRGIPEKVNNAIDEGKGNDVISAAQQMAATVLTAPLQACRILSQQILLLTTNERKTLSTRAYIYGFLMCGIMLIFLILDSNLAGILAVCACILGAFIADRVISSTQQNLHRPKPKTKQKVQADATSKTKSYDDDDLII